MGVYDKTSFRWETNILKVVIAVHISIYTEPGLYEQ